MRNLLIAIFCLVSLFAKADNIDHWLKVEGIKTISPILTHEKDVNNKSFDENKLVLFNSHDMKKLNPIAKEAFLRLKAMPKWKTLSLKDSVVFSKKKSKAAYISYYSSFINVDAYTKASLKIKAYVPCEIYLDGVLVNSSYKKASEKGEDISVPLKMLTGKHALIIKTLSTKAKLFQADVVKDKDYAHVKMDFSTSISRGMTIGDIVNGNKLSRVAMSPMGEYVLVSYTRFTEKTGKNESWKEVIRLKDNAIVYSFRATKAYGIKWLPNTNNLSWMTSNKDGKNIYMYDINNGDITTLVENMQDIDSYNWANDLSYILYTHSVDYSDKNWDLRKLHGIEDRKGYFSSRSFLYKYDLARGQKSLLSWGNKTLSLQDISSDSKKIIVSNSRPNYTVYPYSMQNTYIIDLKTMAVDTIWKDSSYDLACSFSPNGKQLLVKAGGSAFGKIGENIKEGQMANNYDSQLYIYDLKSKKVEPITYDFNPNIQSAKWYTTGKIMIQAQDRDYQFAFEYNVKAKTFKKINLPGEYIKSLTFCNEGLVSSYISCNANSPYEAYFSDLRTSKNKVIANPDKDTYKNVALGEVKDWNFVMDNGNEIIGRYYLPENFDASKKYPLLVYYYGGTSPVSRYFAGRYPFNLFAANGYVVYVLQPSGATGFGQEFAARHQNNWCKTTSDEIITGVKKFSSQHSFINKDKMACMGASYGGFTTEFLQTQTDIFACAISHAGISSISSYWGEGLWGYQYSTEATGKSFPWNRKDIYVDQSSLFNADKIKTPILLLHGTADVNVPTGESIQLYTALKLLGNDVELVLIKDSDHIVLDYKQRIKWNNSIMAYMDKYLKGHAQWWNELYPDKNL
jgi:dipeptidyl aminopeptidase/acylaminoacyl peptidase